MPIRKNQKYICRETTIFNFDIPQTNLILIKLKNGTHICYNKTLNQEFWKIFQNKSLIKTGKMMMLPVIV